ncbi:MAG: (E)-4-hydroxy-3-methylbut-2-enyl-diphosphate synthase [Opitutae bacterium]
MKPPYCASRFSSVRRGSKVVQIGNVGIGGSNPVRVQSMTTTDTLDIQATVNQTLQLAEAGCEIVRITAPNVRAAEALNEIAKRVRDAKVYLPLVADIHFMPNAAMEAAKWVEKVRVNPGNYADRKKFQSREYSDSEYEEELQRLYDAFTPLVLRCKELGRAMRIGTNHGSLSDRIMNRFGDSPKGMAESALEFLRIAESHGYQDMVLSMKSSNPKVMIEAYRLVVAMMSEENMDYPLHLGVTEAGDGEDARIKSAIGIGSLLLDGLGDTLRVSLTEDPVAEIPVAQDLAKRAHSWWQRRDDSREEIDESIDFYEFTRRPTPNFSFPRTKLSVGESHVPAVLACPTHPISETAAIIQEFAKVQTSAKDAPIEGLIVSISSSDDLPFLEILRQNLFGALPLLVVDDQREDPSLDLPKDQAHSPSLLWHASNLSCDPASYARFLAYCEAAGHQSGLAVHPNQMDSDILLLLKNLTVSPVLSLRSDSKINSVGGYRKLCALLDLENIKFPIWIRNLEEHLLYSEDRFFSSLLLDTSILSGSLLCDGIGDLISVEHTGNLDRNRALAYNTLQGARARISKTEFVACPSCGRTLFDLQSTTQKVKKSTSHLKGVTIAVMGCIVNGPGEMADADFGYVGSGPGKIDLYVGKNRVKSAIPERDAVDRLVDLIKEHGRWIEP